MFLSVAKSSAAIADMMKEPQRKYRSEIMSTHKNDEAVSPVIGVILMVSITVILAAVIAAFVFGMAGNFEKSKTVAVTVHKVSSGNVTFTYMGGQDSRSLESIAYAVTDDTGAKKTDTATTLGSSLPVGMSTTINGDFSGQNHAVAVGHFTDGSDRVILDTYV